MSTNTKLMQDAKVYLYHLNNATIENGLRKDECWKLTMANEAGKKEIEHDYYPTVCAEVKKTALQDFSAQVLAGISSNYPKIVVPDEVIETQTDATYFIAHSPQRKIR